MGDGGRDRLQQYVELIRAGAGVGKTCRQCRRGGIRINPVTRSTSLTGCSCMSTRTFFGGIGSGPGVKAGCDCPRNECSN
jgi:hypothetical protein